MQVISILVNLNKAKLFTLVHVDTIVILCQYTAFFLDFRSALY